MSDVDLMRTQVKDMLDYWEDSDSQYQDSLLRLLGKHLQPSKMADSDQDVTSKITGGPAPWDDAVAHLLADISAGSRKIERGLDYACHFTARDRGGSDGNTRAALARIPDLVDLLAANDTEGLMRELTAEARVTIGSWHRGALLLLGAERRWAHVRAEVEVRDENGVLIETYPGIASCCYCGSPVRIQPDLADEGDPERHLPGRSTTSYGAKAWALCVDAGCVDDNGARHSWPVDPWLGTLLTWKRDEQRLTGT